MRKSLISIVLSVFAVFSIISCSETEVERRISVVIPQHEWEIYSQASLWYTLKWTDGDFTCSMHMPEGEREATLLVPCSRTVLVCAYPLGDMSPFGCAVSPDNPQSSYVMTQEDGFLCNLLMDCDRKVTGGLNYEAVKASALACCEDIRLLDGVTLARDMLNGRLRESSFVSLEPVEVVVPGFPGGIWISSQSGGGRLFTETGRTECMQLPPGTWEWYCESLHMEMHVIAGSDGTSFSYVSSSRVNRRENTN